jgi:stage II sporulation protein D
MKRGLLFCNGKRIKNRLRLHSIGGHGEFNGTVYDGDFIIVPQTDAFLCINEVELEDYISSVLKTESWPGWPLEVNKVFAIACRSYVMFKILEAKKSGRSYHVKNTNAHQTYRGKHQTLVLKTAVEQTRGIVLGFKGSPILAMFDCCCGGVIPAHIEDFDFNKVPYLARTYACNFCKQSSLYSWQVSYEHATFESIVEEYLEDILRLSDIHITKKDKAGLVAQVTLKGPRHATIIPGKKLYSLLKEVKSFHFDVQRQSNKIIFTGRGFGHHIGLCQWGARQMVRDGWDYKSILRFYYPGAYFMHLI